MNIIYLSKYASYSPYGLETRHFYLSRELVKRGHQVTVYLSTSNHNLAHLPSQLSDNLDEINVCWIPTLQYANAYGIRRITSWFHFEYRLRKKLRTEQLTSADTVICSSLSLLTICTGMQLKKKWGCKLVFEVRDIWPLVLTRLSNISKLNPIYRLLRYIEVKGYKTADVIVGTMPHLKKHVEVSVSAPKKVLWIPHLVNNTIDYLDTHRYTNELKSIKQNGGTVVGYTGSINKSSALTYLLEAATCFSEKEINIHFVFLGEGPSLEELQNKYNASNIHFYDKIPQSEVVAFCRDCDILYDGYLKSDLYEFGNSRNKYVEYCLAKKPILLAYNGSTHFVEEYDCGTVVSPQSTSALISGLEVMIQKQASELSRLGQNAYTFAMNNLNLKKQIDDFLEELNNV